MALDNNENKGHAAGNYVNKDDGARVDSDLQEKKRQESSCTRE